MKKYLVTIFLILPALSFAAQYTGHITKISVNSKGDNLVFEVANSDSEVCESSWFSLSKAPNQDVSPAEFVTQAYFNNSKITIHANEACAPVTAPTAVGRVSVGTSTEEVQAFIQQMRTKRNNSKK